MSEEWTPPGKPPRERMMGNQPFQRPRAKLARADVLITELAGELKRYTASNPMLSGAIGPNHPAWSPWDIPEQPLAAAAVTGDVLHNLRSSLDLLACEIVRLYNGNDSKVHFPFAGSLAALPEQIDKKGFRQAGPHACELLTALGPYKGGNELLRGLHDLNVQDKHRMVVAHSHQVSNTGEVYLMPDGTLEARYSQSATVSYRLPADGPLAGQELLPTLVSIRDMCGEIIDGFEELLSKDPWFPEWWFKSEAEMRKPASSDQT